MTERKRVVKKAHCLIITVTERGIVASELMLPKEGLEVTRRSIGEYAQALRARYHKATKAEKGRMLDEFIKVTGLHRKAAIRLLRERAVGVRKRRGRPPGYGDLVQTLRAIWEASDRLCSKRLQPFLPEMMRVLRHHGEQHVDPRTEARLCEMSASTIDRLLRPYRSRGPRKGISTTKPSILKNLVPVRTFSDWDKSKFGFVEVDLVAHCGESTEGFYLNTLCAVDVASGWTECLPVLGKAQMLVKQAVHHMRQRLPCPLLGLDSDNGSEFINQCLYDYCRKEKITFTKSRPYKKNDSCYVEQKNGNVVRRLVGYDRYDTRLAFECLGRLYACVRLYTNFFQPNAKLMRKTRHGASVHKVYDTPKTPYQRLLESGTLPESKRAELATSYTCANPVLLLTRMRDNLEQLWKLANRSTSVTRFMTQPEGSR
jgi:hypothetical protein